ncbi:hypothetical protein PHYPSEUDO_000164 [Phytophthora pseudosyringae]|uniref:Uncharacterized protein n=1 Tax=Phytophthora pseudosyringae TaxID=221518 RepID=A0A8T1WGD1_9STRA|nr:hypothetical protein PHYPSEUDO_000164 [Phytophthora pseudosyringae]
MGTKKRRRAQSFQAEQDGDDGARQRLAAFHARMFELPQEEAAATAPETPRVLFKPKHKKRKRKSADEDDGEPVPLVKFNKTKPKKEKKKKKKVATAVAVMATEKEVAGPAVVKLPGASTTATKRKPQDKKAVKTAKKQAKKVRKAAVQAPQWHSLQNEGEGDEDDGVDPLEQALGSVKEIVTKQVAKQPHKKGKTTGKSEVASKTDQATGPAKEAKDSLKDAVDSNVFASTEHLSKTQKKKVKNKQRKMRLREANGGNTRKTSAGTANDATNGDSIHQTEADPTVGNTANDSAPIKTTAPSPTSSGSRKKRKKSLGVKSMKSASPMGHTSAEPRKGTPLLISGEAENKTEGVKANTAPAKSGKSAMKVAVPSKKAVPNEEKKTTKPLMPIAASLVKDSKKKNDMFLPARETPSQPVVAAKRVERTVSHQVVNLTDESSSSESEVDGGFDFEHRNGDDSSLFARLIDSAARERWELVEVGRLVRLFAAEWCFKEGKTARFLRDTCPELVSVDFLEGLGVNLSAKQLVQVFEAGSGNSGVLMNKMASAVENGHLSVRDPSFVSALERRVALMESNAEVMEFLHPLLESLSTVRDVGCLLKQLCEHWQLERKLALVQQVLLSNVFDDLDGNQDDILLDLPDLTGRLDFPSRLDQEDVDENGNLKGFLANEDSDYSGEERSEDEDEENSENDEDPYEGETDSDEEVEIAGRPRGRNHFIEDEADVGEEDEEEEREHHDDDESSSSSDSD